MMRRLPFGSLIALTFSALTFGAVWRVATGVPAICANALPSRFVRRERNRGLACRVNEMSEILGVIGCEMRVCRILKLPAGNASVKTRMVVILVVILEFY